MWACESFAEANAGGWGGGRSLVINTQTATDSAKSDGTELTLSAPSVWLHQSLGGRLNIWRTLVGLHSNTQNVKIFLITVIQDDSLKRE